MQHFLAVKSNVTEIIAFGTLFWMLLYGLIAFEKKCDLLLHLTL